MYLRLYHDIYVSLKTIRSHAIMIRVEKFDVNRSTDICDAILATFSCQWNSAGVVTRKRETDRISGMQTINRRLSPLLCVFATIEELARYEQLDLPV